MWPRLLEQVEVMKRLQTGLLATVRKLKDPAVKNILFGEACWELDNILKSNSKTDPKTCVKEDEDSNYKKEKVKKDIKINVKEKAASAMKKAPLAKMRMININTQVVKQRPADQQSISSYFTKG